MSASQAVTVAKVYGFNLGPQKPDLEAYWEKCAAKHPAVRLGWFGKHTDSIAIVYHQFGFQEMYDDGALNKSSMIINADDMRSFQTLWDSVIVNALDDLGFKDTPRTKIGWNVVITTFKPEAIHPETSLVTA